MAILDARSPRFRPGGDKSPDANDPPSRISQGAGPAPDPGGFAGLFDPPSESSSATPTTWDPSASTGVYPGGFGGGSDSASSTTLSATPRPTPRPTATGVPSGGSASSSASKGGSSGGGSNHGVNLTPAAIIGIVAGVVFFVFLSSFIHFWSREKKRSFDHRSRFRHEQVLWKSIKVTTGLFIITWLWKRCRKPKDPDEPEYFEKRESTSDADPAYPALGILNSENRIMYGSGYVLSRPGCRELEYTPCEPGSPGQAPELTGVSAPGPHGPKVEGRRDSAGSVVEREDSSLIARPPPTVQSLGARAEASRDS